MKFDDQLISLLTNHLNEGHVAYMLTDTIPGLVARAQDEQAMNKIFELKQRDANSQLPTLIHDVKDISKLGAKPHSQQVYDEYWPGPVTIVHEASIDTPIHIHRGNGEFGLRLPNVRWLRDLIALTGPLSATSANPQGKPAALSVEQAKDYFGDFLTLYVEHEPLDDDKPSRLIKPDYGNGTVEILR